MNDLNCPDAIANEGSGGSRVAVGDATRSHADAASATQKATTANLEFISCLQLESVRQGNTAAVLIVHGAARFAMPCRDERCGVECGCALRTDRVAWSSPIHPPPSPTGAPTSMRRSLAVTLIAVTAVTAC